jgi:hypothetical protein
VKYQPLIAGLFLLVGSAGVFYGQTPDAPASSGPPRGPLIAQWAPDSAQWVETTKSVKPPIEGQDGAPQGGSPPVQEKPELVVTVVKSGGIRHVTIGRGGGERYEVWCERDLEVVTRPEWALPVLLTGPSETGDDWLNYSNGDFGGFDWISTTTFSGIQKFGGHDCMVFQMKLPVMSVYSIAQASSTNAQDTQSVQATAYIDLQTRLPVEQKYGEKITSYAFSAPPSAKLSVPKNVQAAIDKWLDDVKKAAPKRVTP